MEDGYEVRREKKGRKRTKEGEGRQAFSGSAGAKIGSSHRAHRFAAANQNPPICAHSPATASGADKDRMGCWDDLRASIIYS